MANEFTLADFERIAPDPLTKFGVRTWREQSPIMDMLNFRVSNRLTEKIIRYNSLNAATWRKIGESFTQTKVNPDPIEERLFFLGDKVDVPYEYVKAETLGDPEMDQVEAYLKGMAFTFNDAFFTNTPAANEDAVVGMWYRIKNDLGSGQYFDANLDISPDTAVASYQAKAIDVIESLLDLVDGNPADKVLACGRTMYLRLQSIFRNSGLLSTTTDQLGRQFMTYGEGGAKLLNVGYKYDQSTQILGDAEDGITALTGGADSSLYCIRFGSPYVEGWCQEMPMIDRVGLTEDRVNYRTVIRFSPGLFMSSPRSAALAWGWTAA